MHIQIPGGFFAECRDGPTVGGRKLLKAKAQVMYALMARDTEDKGIDLADGEDQKAVEELSPVKQATIWSEEFLNATEDVQNSLVVAMLVSWTLPQPIPASIEDIESIEDRSTQIAIYTIRNELFTDWTKYLAEPNFEPDPDPKALAVSSAHSNGNSGASTTPTQTSAPKSSSAGTSTSTGDSSPAPTPNT